jgi:hypothetical protein
MATWKIGWKACSRRLAGHSARRIDMRDFCAVELRCNLRPDAPSQLLTTLQQQHHLPSLEAAPLLHSQAISVQSYIADDELDEYLSFVESLAPYSATVGFVGYVRLAWEHCPLLIYFRDGYALML